MSFFSVHAIKVEGVRFWTKHVQKQLKHSLKYLNLCSTEGEYNCKFKQCKSDHLKKLVYVLT